MNNKTIVVGTLDIPGRFESACRVYGTTGIAPTLLACKGPKIMVKIWTR